MTDNGSGRRNTALDELEEALQAHRRAQAADAETSPAAEPHSPAGNANCSPRDALAAHRGLWARFIVTTLSLGGIAWRRLSADLCRPVVRYLGLGITALAVVGIVSLGALWWRLSAGPISLDLATPWLTAAIEENFGGRYRIQVGGTQLERDAEGRTAVRMIDVVVRDREGHTVALARKAEVGIAGTSLLVARPRAESLSLVDTNMLIRIQPDGQMDMYAGGDRPFASIEPQAKRHSASAGPSLESLSEHGLLANVTLALAWIDGLNVRRDGGEGLAGFDGYDLHEIGISNGGLTIEDQRTSQRWSVERVGVRLIRPRGGGVAVAIGSDRPDHPWLFNAALTPGRFGNRHLQIEARSVPIDDVLALRMSPDPLRFDGRVSASVQGDFSPEGEPQYLNGTVAAVNQANGGTVEFGLDWDASRGTLRVPFKVEAGALRSTLRAEFQAPQKQGEPWHFGVGGGWILIDALEPKGQQLVLRRVSVRGHIDPERQRVMVEKGDFGTREFGDSTPQDVSLAISGVYDYGGENPSLKMGLAGYPMPVSSFKRLWPTFVAPWVRDWVIEHLIDGTVERIDIAADAPLASLKEDGPSIPEGGLFVDIVTSNTTLVPVAGLPPIRNADLTASITGSTARVMMGKGSVEVAPGRRLQMTDGLFDVPNSTLAAPPAKVSFRVEGGAPVAVEFLELERLRDFARLPFEPAGIKGNVAAEVKLELPLQADLPRGSTRYDLAFELSNFAADGILAGHKVEAKTLKITADNDGYRIGGDVRINEVPAQLDYRKASAETEAEVTLSASLDAAARTRLGFDFGTGMRGSLPVKVSGRIGSDDTKRFDVQADLTPVEIDQLLPGWVKPAKRPAKIAFQAVHDKTGTRLNDMLIDGSGVLARGRVELDPSGGIRSADFPVYATSEGDKATLAAERKGDGMLRLTMRGDVYDGRNVIASVMSGSDNPKEKPRQFDIELDIRLGAVLGHHGETLRGLDLRLVRRGGQVRTFNLNARIGRDTPLVGDVRNRASTNRPILYLETDDAGALFRFTDVYPRVVGGSIWVAMDPPNQTRTPQNGVINLRRFAVRGEEALDRVAGGRQQGNARSAIDFSLARAEFTRTPGRMVVREGLVRGPILGATIEGNIDFTRDQVSMRGTLVPLYGINNIFGQIPIVGLFLGGGSNEGLLGITYEVTGPPGNPRLAVNPLSAIAPGVLRKFFEFRDSTGDVRSFAQPGSP